MLRLARPRFHHPKEHDKYQIKSNGMRNERLNDKGRVGDQKERNKRGPNEEKSCFT